MNWWPNLLATKYFLYTYMAAAPEREPQAPAPPEGVVEHPTEIPVEVERGMPGVKRTPAKVAAQVSDPVGKPLIQTPQSQSVTVQVPTDQTQLDDWAKGSPTDSLTGFAMFWIRMIKKALHFGWRVVRPAKPTDQKGNTK